MHRLGGDVIGFASDTSTSTAKGETLSDTIRTIDQYADVIVVRHPEIGSANRAAEAAEVPVINAGDGAGQHPTQALLDLYTLKSELGSLDGLRLALCGDLLNGRTVHSGVELYQLFNIEFIFVSPPTLKMPNEIITKLKNNNISIEETDSLEYGLRKADALYMTRIQKERFEDSSEYAKVKDSYVLSKDLVEDNNPTIKILHPLPRVNELDRSLDDLPNARYFQQVKNGVYIRMALLAAILAQ
jgi:aspartate carbamoyltransferase